MEIYERMKEIRRSKHFTREEVAKELKVSQNAVVDMEKGKRVIKPEEIQKVCKLFDISADMLIFGAGSENRSKNLAQRIECLDKRDQDEILQLIRMKEEWRKINSFMSETKEEQISHKVFVEATQNAGASLEKTIRLFEERFEVRYIDAVKIVEEYWKRTGPQIEELQGISKNVKHALMRAGYKSAGDLMSIEDKEALLKIRNIGPESIESLLKTLEEEGYDVSHLH